MIELTRTRHLWRTTARRLELRTIGRPDLAEQIRWALPGDEGVPLHTPLTVSFLEEDAALIERLVPVSGWGGPTISRGRQSARSGLGTPADAVAAAEAIISAHQHRLD